MSEVVVLVIDYRHGTEMTVWRSEDLAKAALLEWIELSGRLMAEPRKPNESIDDLAYRYFDENHDEWYRIDVLVVGGPQDLVAAMDKPHGYRRYDWEFEDSSKNVSVSQSLGRSGTFVLDLDTGGRTDIDIDIDGETVAIIRNGEAVTE
nr:hypothetical protein [Rhodococcus sp. (in: high G+C Gram-positive bacteria)]